jgi:hypothetical protein
MTYIFYDPTFTEPYTRDKFSAVFLLLKLFLFLPPKDNSSTVKCNTRMCPLLHNFKKCPIETHDSASVKLSTSTEENG